MTTITCFYDTQRPLLRGSTAGEGTGTDPESLVSRDSKVRGADTRRVRAAPKTLHVSWSLKTYFILLSKTRLLYIRNEHIF